MNSSLNPRHYRVLGTGRRDIIDYIVMVEIMLSCPWELSYAHGTYSLSTSTVVFMGVGRERRFLSTEFLDREHLNNT